MNEIKAEPDGRARRRDQGRPGAGVSDRRRQAAILAATIDSWTGRAAGGARPRRHRPRRAGPGRSRYLQSLGLVKSPVTTDDLVRRTSCRPDD